MDTFDHPIFVESIRYIKSHLENNDFDPLEQEVLKRIIHSSGDFDLQSLLRFTPRSCHQGIDALLSGAPIITDTAMAAAAIEPMARRTLNPEIYTALDWAPKEVEPGLTRTGLGMKLAWRELSQKFPGKKAPIVLIGSAPQALNVLLDLVQKGANRPSLIIGMPVGFIGVLESKERLFNSGIPQICIEGTRGGAGIAAAALNALLRSTVSIS